MASTHNHQETFWHPRTGTRYVFPKDTRRYLALCDRMKNRYPCDNRHLDCAAWDGGPCATQVFSWYVVEPADEGGAR